MDQPVSRALRPRPQRPGDEVAFRAGRGELAAGGFGFGLEPGAQIRRYWIG